MWLERLIWEAPRDYVCAECPEQHLTTSYKGSTRLVSRAAHTLGAHTSRTTPHSPAVPEGACPARPRTPWQVRRCRRGTASTDTQRETQPSCSTRLTRARRRTPGFFPAGFDKATRPATPAKNAKPPSHHATASRVDRWGASKSNADSGATPSCHTSSCSSCNCRWSSRVRETLWRRQQLHSAGSTHTLVDTTYWLLGVGKPVERGCNSARVATAAARSHACGHRAQTHTPRGHTADQAHS